MYNKYRLFFKIDLFILNLNDKFNNIDFWKNLSITITIVKYAKHDWNAGTIFWYRSKRSRYGS